MPTKVGIVQTHYRRDRLLVLCCAIGLLLFALSPIPRESYEHRANIVPLRNQSSSSVQNTSSSQRSSSYHSRNISVADVLEVESRTRPLKQPTKPAIALPQPTAESHGIQKSRNGTRRAYVLLVDNKRLECPARIAAARLQQLDNSTDVVVMALKEFRGSVPQATKTVIVPSTGTFGNPQWFNTFAKFHAVNLGYEEVMFFDLDVVFLRSPAHWFSSTSREVAAPPAYWLKQPFLMSGGPMIFRASPALSRRVDKVLRKRAGKYASEMDWFNSEFSDAERIDDGFATLLCGEFIAGDGVFKHFQRKRKLQSPEQVLSQATLVHFIAEWKPWKHPIRKAANASKPLRRVLDIWVAGKDGRSSENELFQHWQESADHAARVYER